MSRRILVLGIGLVLMAGCAPATQELGQQGSTARPQAEKLTGYAEWRMGDALVVDGQRVVAQPTTKFKSKGFERLDLIPLGHEVNVKGTRRTDGALVADEVEARVNGQGMFESDIQSATGDLEARWLQSGAVFEEDDKGKERVIGRIVPQGPAVDRVRRIMTRVTPPYVNASNLRVHVVDTKDWNAMAMGNGALWVFTGLLNDMDDDEVAIILGHELAHYTHEHSRREFKRAFWGQLIAVGAMLATEALTDDERKKAAVAVGAMALLLVKQNGYSRNLEDQADRVGLRYAYEGGYDVSKGPALWVRFRDKYGDQNGLMNFFLGEHSQASARVKNLNREIALNYAAAAR
jgi:Zn-dependent protease with chaperone function